MMRKLRGAWPDWIESEEGKRCADPKTLDLTYRQGEFLENRLWLAFIAGAKSERERLNPIVEEVNKGKR